MLHPELNWVVGLVLEVDSVVIQGLVVDPVGLVHLVVVVVVGLVDLVMVDQAAAAGLADQVMGDQVVVGLDGLVVALVKIRVGLAVAVDLGILVRNVPVVLVEAGPVVLAASVRVQGQVQVGLVVVGLVVLEMILISNLYAGEYSHFQFDPS